MINVDIIPQVVGHNCYKIRMNNNLTQEEMAEELDISVKTIQNIEYGNRLCKQLRNFQNSQEYP